MRKIEAFFIGCILVPVPILFCFVAAWFVGAVLLNEKVVPTVALSGAGAGIIIGIVFLKRWVRNAYKINNFALAALYLFYSIGVLGFCMGVPILNFGVGILAGIYTARKMHHANADEKECRYNIRKTAIFSAVVMMLMCCLTGFWALIGGLVGSRFETPILSFTFTAAILIGIVLTGGFVLSILQYWLTALAAKIVVRLSGQ
jgi:hypothetical protein